jgi:phosphoglycolate phosphatase
MASARSPLPESEIASYVGDGAFTLMQRATGLEPMNPELALLHDKFRAFYTANPATHTLLYPTVRETLERLSKSPYRVALCTNKPRSTTDRVLDVLELTHFFAATVCADDLPHKKPHPEPLFHIANAFELDPRELAMIGDGPQDIECGRAAGAITVGVTYGIRPVAEVLASHPDHLVDSLSRVLELFPW